jgi:hypothetical protein
LFFVFCIWKCFYFWKILGAELEAHAKDQNWDHQATLEMWKGNLGQALKTVVSNDMLDANWVAMSILGMTARKIIESWKVFKLIY